MYWVFFNWTTKSAFGRALFFENTIPTVYVQALNTMHNQMPFMCIKHVLYITEVMEEWKYFKYLEKYNYIYNTITSNT